MYILIGIIIGIAISIAAAMLLACVNRKSCQPNAHHSDLALPNKLFETIADMATESIIMAGPDQKIIYVNQAFTDIHGYLPTEAIGKTPAFLKHPKQFTDTHGLIKEALQKNQQWHGIVVNQSKDTGAPITLDTTISPLLSDNKLIGFIAAGKDITHEKELEQQLIHAHKMEAIGTLAGGIAHDFNNLLSAIVGYTEIAMLDSEKQKPVKAYLDQIMKASKRAADLISQILTFSRRKSENKQALYLKPIISESIKLLRGTFPSSISIESNLDENAPPISANATHIHQVIMNICTNASHAMESNGGTLSIKLQKLLPTSSSRSPWLLPLPTDRPCALITFADTGKGMSQETCARIFEPYFTTKTGGRGTGLGLATVQGIVQAHDGVIHVESEEGKGSTFQIAIPSCSAEEVFEEKEIKMSEIPEGNAETILVVDDEEPLAMMVSTALTYLGYKVETFFSSTKALEAFQANPTHYDCIISDQTMPTLSGADLSKYIFKIRPDIPFILCSGYSENLNKDTIRDLGISEFVEKPVTGKQLAKVVYQHLHP